MNRLNGDVAEVGRIGVTTNTLACDANGTFYSQKLETGKVYSYTLETMDAPELLVDVGKNSMSIQGLEIDPNTGMLCWNSCRAEQRFRRTKRTPKPPKTSPLLRPTTAGASGRPPRRPTASATVS